MNERILSEPVYTADWDSVLGSRRLSAYRWMAGQMAGHGISIGAKAPIWGWVRGDNGSRPPSLQTARSMLSDRDLRAGISTLEIEVPDGLLLPSSYHGFCAVVDLTLDHPDDAIPESCESIFTITDWNEESGIQGTIPRIERAWILETRAMPLEPNDWSYDPTAPV